jgi:hypothetical protein
MKPKVGEFDLESIYNSGQLSILNQCVEVDIDEMAKRIAAKLYVTDNKALNVALDIAVREASQFIQSEIRRQEKVKVD